MRSRVADYWVDQRCLHTTVLSCLRQWQPRNKIQSLRRLLSRPCELCHQPESEPSSRSNHPKGPSRQDISLANRVTPPTPRSRESIHTHRQCHRSVPSQPSPALDSTPPRPPLTAPKQ